MTDLIFDTPWWLLLTISVIGVAVAWSGNQRGDGKTRNVGLLILGLAVLLGVTSYVFETDLEKVNRLNNELVQSVPNKDWSKFADLLDADATLGDVTNVYYANRKKLVEGAKDNVARWGLQSVAVTHTTLAQDRAGITVDISVLSKQTATEGFLPAATSSWRMIWDKTGGRWRCHEIKCLGIGGDKGGAAGRWFK